MIFIAEVGMNHNGNFALAYELIRLAKNSGADIVKFQLGWRDQPGEINQITPEIITSLKKWADYFEIRLMFSVITRDAYETLRPFCMPEYKIASRTVRDDPELVEEILREGKPTYISLGMWDSNVVPFPTYNNAIYLWCKSLYPTEPWDILDLPKDFRGSRFQGYSDHTIGIETALIAVSRGAKIVEKHFTLDKSDRTIRDHALSATPDEFLSLVQLGRDIEKKINLGI